MNDKAPFERVAPDQHAETHGVPVRQRQVYRKFALADTHRGANNDAVLDLTVGTPDRPPFDNRRGAEKFRLFLFLLRMQVEFSVFDAALQHCLEAKRVDSRRFRARIDLGADRPVAKLRQFYELAPADLRRRGFLLAFFCGRYRAGSLDMQRVTERPERGFLQGFALGRVSMDCSGDVFKPRAHLDSEPERGGKFRNAAPNGLQA